MSHRYHISISVSGVCLLIKIYLILFYFILFKCTTFYIMASTKICFIFGRNAHIGTISVIGRYLFTFLKLIHSVYFYVLILHACFYFILLFLLYFYWLIYITLMISI